MRTAGVLMAAATRRPALQPQRLRAGAGHQRHQVDAAGHRDPHQRPLVVPLGDQPLEPVPGRAGVALVRLQHHLLGADAGVGLVLHAARIDRGQLDAARAAGVDHQQPTLPPQRPRREDVLGADHARHLHVERRREDLVDRADLADRAVDQDRQPIAERQRLGAVVRDHDGRHAGLFQQVAQLAAQRLAGGGVQRRERLVEQEQAGPRRQRPGQGHALLLAAGELGRPAPQQRAHAEPLGQLPHPGGPLRSRQPVEPVAEVGRHRQVREERVLLEEQSHPAGLRRHVDAARPVEPGLLAEADEAGVGAIQPGQRAQHRGLAGARGAEEHGDGRPLQRPPAARPDDRAAREAAHHLEAQRAGHAERARRCSA